jgi:hypothetical protein
MILDLTHDLVRKVCNFSGSCASHGFPPRQDPELEAREHRNRFNGGTSGGEVSPKISKVSSVHLHCATTRRRGPRRAAGSLFRPGVLYEAWRRLSTIPFPRAATDSRRSRVLEIPPFSKGWLFLKTASAGGCRKHMPGATSVSYAVFEPFSKGLVGGSS